MPQSAEKKLAEGLQKEAGCDYTTAVMATRKFIRDRVEKGATRGHAVITARALLQQRHPDLLGLVRTAIST